MRIKLINKLDESTTVHWHGIRLGNRADGVPGFTQQAIKPDDDYVYAFTPPDSGTYMLHSHVGTQLDRGLYAPLIVEPRRETVSYDRESVLMFDDWLDGLGRNPQQQLRMLRATGMNMNGMSMNGQSGGMGAGGSAHTDLQGRRPRADSLARLANELEAGRLDPGDVRDYPLYLVNGRPGTAPATVVVRRGDVLRLRLINPSADTLYCVFVEGHELEVVQADGSAVHPVRTDALVLGMGERYDVLVRANASGVSRIIGVPLGKTGRALALLRYQGQRATAPAPSAPLQMPRRVLSYEDLRPVQALSDTVRGRPREIRLDLTQRDSGYVWMIGGQAFPDAETIKLRQGEHVRFVMRNRTMMPHPMHLHGHSFAVGGADGVIKDTAIALPMRELTLDWVADNRGAWAYHCHNVYHQEAGMMRKVQVA